LSLLHSNQIGEHPRGAHQAFESEALTLITPRISDRAAEVVCRWCRLRANLGHL
jgi:hypothetical protein